MSVPIWTGWDLDQPRIDPGPRGARRSRSSIVVPGGAAAGGLHGCQELQVRMIRQRRPEGPVVLEQDDRSTLRVRDAGRSAPLLEGRRREGLSLHPPRVLV